MKEKTISVMKKLIRPLIFAGIGALAGLIYYRFFGCTSGCAITSNATLTVIYTSVMGLLLSVITQKQKG